ncbi:MAG: type IV pilus assembly protein PilM [Candidatus Obscuribacterales bacterium]|nr:type IV pilus assembly protein PilM [Candidatus Obscuribacterales bacterium]
MFSFGKKPGPQIGIDINSSTLSVLQLEKTKAEVKVSRFASMMAPPDIVREGLLAEPEACGQALKELLDSAGFPAKGPRPEANLCVPGQAVVIRLMPVPKGMPGDELGEVVRQEAINNLPFPIDEANLDWTRVPGTVRVDPDGVEREDILIAAMQRMVAEGYWKMVEAAGITLGRLEISSLSIIRSLAVAGTIGADSGLSLLVNIRQEATDITLVNKTVPLFTRSVLFGVDSVVETMARGMGMTMEETLDLLPQIKLIGAPTVDPRMSQAAQYAHPICADLAAELGRSLDFYMSQVGLVSVDQVILCGSGTAIGEIDQFISNRLNLKTIIANPFQGLVYDSAQILEDRRAYHAALLGLVVPVDSLPENTVEINLNQSEPDFGGAEGDAPPERPTPWFVPALAGGGGLALLSLMVFLYFQFLVLPSKDKEMAELEAQISEGKQHSESMDKQKTEITALETRKKALETIINHGMPMTVLMKTIQENTPGGVSIVSIKVADGMATIDGICTDFSRPSHLAINLQGSNLFTRTDMNYVQRSEKHPETVNFEIGAMLGSGLESQRVDNPLATIAGAPSVNKQGKVLDFFATWCPPCQRMKPFIEQARQKYGEQIEFVTVDIDDPKNAQLVSRYNVKSVPNLFFLDPQGNLVTQLKGFGGTANEIYAACDKLKQVAAQTVTK